MKLSKKNKIDYNPIRGIVTVNGEEVKFETFCQTCFENGWEGTLFKLQSMKIAFEKAIWEELLKPELERLK